MEKIFTIIMGMGKQLLFLIYWMFTKKKNKLFFQRMWGVNTSYVSGITVVDKFESENKEKVKEIAVVGSGAVGLMTALVLTDRGYNVTLYSKVFP